MAILAGIPAQYQRPFSRHYSLLTPSGWWHSGHLISLPSKWPLSIQWHRIKKLCTYFRPNKLPLQLDEIKYLLYLLITENNCRLDPDLRLYISNNNNGENLFFSPGSMNIIWLRMLIEYPLLNTVHVHVYFDQNLNFRFYCISLKSLLNHLKLSILSARSKANIFAKNTGFCRYWIIFFCIFWIFSVLKSLWI